MDLFTVDNSIAIPSTFALMIEPFKSIWERDTSSGKALAIRELSYVELLCSRKRSNPFSGYPETERSSKVIENLFPEETFTPDDLILEAIIQYKKLQHEASPSLQMIESSERALDNLREFLNSVDIKELSSRGMPMYKPSEIMIAVKQLPELLTSMDKLRERVNHEIEESAKTRGQRQIGYFERPDNK